MRWSLEHLLLPIVIVIVSLVLNNYYQEKQQPSILVFQDPHKVENASTKEKENYKISCPFRIQNRGGSSSKNRPITFTLLGGYLMADLQISNEFRGFYEITGGGAAQNFVILSVNLPKEKTIEGNIIFYTNVQIPEVKLSPLKASY